MKLILAAAALCALVAVSQGEDSKVLMCYWGTWSIYRSGNGTFTVSDLDVDLCTHFIYSFAVVNGNTSSIELADPWADLATDGGHGLIAKFVGLKEQAPEKKFLIAIGGWNEGSEDFSLIVNDDEARATFVQSILDFIIQYGFDGCDMDWEYPARRGGIPTDVGNFTLLLKELKAAFEPYGYLLTAAVSATESSAEISYDVPSISEYLDYINIMAYDYHVGSDPELSFNAPLLAGSYETGDETQLNVVTSLEYWIEAGADPSKMVLGLGAYGHSFTMNNTSENQPGDASAGAGEIGPFTQEAGTLSYLEICLRQMDGGWTDVWSEEQLVPYTYKDDQWISYDSPRSITIKTKYAKKLGLAGVMFWAIDHEDFAGRCGDVTFPLIRAAKSALCI